MVLAALFLSSGTLPSHCTHSPAEIFMGVGEAEDVPGGTGTSCRLKWAGENTLPLSLCTDVFASLSWLHPLPLCQPPSNIRCSRRLSFCSYCHFDTPTSILAHTNSEATWLWGLPLFAACLLNHLLTTSVRGGRAAVLSHDVPHYTLGCDIQLIAPYMWSD